VVAMERVVPPPHPATISGAQSNSIQRFAHTLRVRITRRG
jgi:hypothetical protein